MSYARGGAFTALGRNIRDFGNTVGSLRREEEERRIAEEDRTRLHQFQDTSMELDLVDRGGGLGEAPMIHEELGPKREFQGPESIIPEPSQGFSPAGADGFMQTPEFERREAPDQNFEMSSTDPQYQNIAGGYAHIMQPDALEAKRDQASFDRFSGRVQGGLQGFASGQITPESEEFGASAAGLLHEGVDPRGWMPTPIEEPQEDQWESRLRTAMEHGITRREYLLGREPVGRGGGSDTGFTPLQILNHAQERYAIYETDEDNNVVRVGFTIPEEEIRKLAAAEARGEEVEWPAAGQGQRSTPLWDAVNQQLQGGGRTRAFTQDEVEQARAGLQSEPPDQWRKILLESGASPAQIRQVLGEAP